MVNERSCTLASYHLAVKTISRSVGRTATAAAAYRAGEIIHDHRIDEVHDYTKRSGVEHTEIVLPDHAPEWAHDRAALWNAAEVAERRKDAKVAREFEIALPHELTAIERRELVREFAQEVVDRHGVGVDIAIHEPGREGDHRNHHAHLLLTTRRITLDGLGEKTRELDVIQTSRGEIEHWRERWAEVQNHALERAGHDQRVDHRSFKEREIEIEPLPELTRAEYQVERRAKRKADRDGVDYEPVTEAGQKRADAEEKRNLERYIEKGMEWLKKVKERVSEPIKSVWSAIGKVDRQQQLNEQAAERERSRREAAEKAAREERKREIEAQRERDLARERERDRGMER